MQLFKIINLKCFKIYFKLKLLRISNLLKILFLTESLSTAMGGIATGTIHMAIGLSNHFSKSQHQIITQEDNNSDCFDDEYNLPKNLKIVKLPKFGLKNYPIYLSMRKSIKSFNPDIIYLKGLWRHTSIEAYIWKKSHPEKILIVSPSGMLQPKAMENKKILKLISIFLIEHKLFKVCDLLQCVSILEKNHLLGSKFKFKKVICVPEGLPKIKYKPKKKKNFTKELVSISRIDPIKGIDILLEACKDLEFNGWKITIYGNGSKEYINRLQNNIFKNNLEGKVTLKKGIFSNKKYQVLSSASAFILPSYSESFAISVAEAMSFGLPIITTTKTPWSIIGKKNLGWLINPDINELKEVLEKLFFSSEKKLLKIGENAKQYLSKRYDLMETSSEMKAEILALNKKRS